MRFLAGKAFGAEAKPALYWQLTIINGRMMMGYYYDSSTLSIYSKEQGIHHLKDTCNNGHSVYFSAPFVVEYVSADQFDVGLCGSSYRNSKDTKDKNNSEFPAWNND